MKGPHVNRDRRSGVRSYIEHHPIFGDITHYITGARRDRPKGARK